MHQQWQLTNRKAIPSLPYPKIPCCCSSSCPKMVKAFENSKWNLLFLLPPGLIFPLLLYRQPPGEHLTLQTSTSSIF